MTSSLSREERITFRRLMHHAELSPANRSYLVDLLPKLTFEELLELLATHPILGDRRFVDALERTWPSGETGGRMNACVHNLGRLLDESAYADLVARVAPALLAGNEQLQLLALTLFVYLRGSHRYESIARNLRIRHWFPEVATLPLRFMGERRDGVTLLRRLTEYAATSAERASAVWDLAITTEDRELEDAVVPVALEFLGRPETPAPVVRQLATWTQRWIDRDDRFRAERVSRVFALCERAHVAGCPWEELSAGWVAGVPAVMEELIERALDDGVVLMGAVPLLLPRLARGRRDAWDLLFMFRLEERPVGAALLVQMLTEGRFPDEADDAFWTSYQDLWRWVEAQQQDHLDQIARASGVPAAHLTHFESDRIGFIPLTRRELVMKLLDARPTASSARAFFSEFVTLERFERCSVLTDPRVAALADLLSVPHDQLPPIGDFKFDPVGIQNFRAFHPRCAASEMRDCLLQDSWDHAPRLDGPAVLLALEGDDGSCRAEFLERLRRLPVAHLAEVRDMYPDWVSEAMLLQRVNETVEPVRSRTLAQLPVSALVDRALSGPVEELKPLLDRIPTENPERRRLRDILVRRLESRHEFQVAPLVGAMLDSRSAWDTLARQILLSLVRAKQFDLVGLLIGGAPVRRPEMVPEPQRKGALQFWAAIHGALAIALLGYCKDLSERQRMDEAERVVDAVALLDPPPPVVREMWKLEKALESHDRLRDRLVVLRRLNRRLGGTEAGPDGVFDSLRDLKGGSNA